jgi:hypothetical protein
MRKQKAERRRLIVKRRRFARQQARRMNTREEALARKHPREFGIWKAMLKFANDEPLTELEWQDLSWLTMIDQNRLYFGPDNIRWATTDKERADNLAFYQSLGRTSIQ